MLAELLNNFLAYLPAPKPLSSREELMENFSERYKNVVVVMGTASSKPIRVGLVILSTRPAIASNK